MGFETVAPKHVHGPGCGHTASQVATDAKTQPAVVRSQFVMAELPSSGKEAAPFLGTSPQRFASATPLAQKAETSLPTEKPPQSAQAQPAQQSSAQVLVPQKPAAPQVPVQQSQALQSQVHSPQAQSTMQPAVQQPQVPVAQPHPQAPQNSAATPQTPGNAVAQPAQAQGKTESAPQTQTTKMPGASSLPTATTTAAPAAASVLTFAGTPAVQAQPLAALPPQAPMLAAAGAAPQRGPQPAVMSPLNQVAAAQVFSGSPQSASPMITGMILTLLKNMLPTTDDASVLAAMMMSATMRERSLRRKKMNRKLGQAPSEDVSDDSLEDIIENVMGPHSRFERVEIPIMSAKLP